MSGKSYRFTVGYLRAIYVVFFGFVTLMQVVQAFNPGKGGVGLTVFALVTAALCLLLTIGGARAATIVADDHAVEYRSLLRTRRWTRPQLERFEARDSREGWMRYGRRVLFVREAHGRIRKLQEINARPSRSPNPIDQVAEQLNRRAG